MPTPRNLLFSLALCALAALPQLPLRTQTSAELVSHQSGWGISLHADQPFYTLGDTARARFRLENFTSEGTFGLLPKTWDNGCAYQLTVIDDQGQTVWQPFTPCFFGMGFFNLGSGQVLRAGADIPLVYQNNIGVGTPGAPLAPGAYKLQLAVSFGGPTRTASAPVGSTPGLGHTASVPIRIEP